MNGFRDCNWLDLETNMFYLTVLMSFVIATMSTNKYELDPQFEDHLSCPQQ